jgi:VWFA-related protein
MRRYVLLAGLVAGLLAQEADTVFRSGVEEVVVPVTVKDGDRFVNGLEERDLRLFDNGRGQNFKLDFTAVPLSMVVAIQGDQQVGHYLPKIKAIGPLLENLILGEAGEAALVVFDHRQRVVQDFTNDGKLFTKALDKITPGSTTSAMIDAIHTGANLLRNRPKNRRRVMLLISETRDRGSEGNLREALELAENHNVTIYTVNVNRLISVLTNKGQPPRPDPFPPGSRPRIPGASPVSTGNVSGSGASLSTGEFMPLIIEMFRQAKSIFFDNTAEAFTKYTGGREYGFTDTKDLERALTDIGEELHSQYLMTYQPGEATRKEGGWHEIRVEAVNRNARGKNYDVRARPGYWSAARP